MAETASVEGPGSENWAVGPTSLEECGRQRQHTFWELLLCIVSSTADKSPMQRINILSAPKGLAEEKR